MTSGEAEVAERLQRKLLQTTLGSIGDVVISTDAAGRIVFVNDVARSLLRPKAADLTGIELDEVFQIVNEETRHEVDGPVMKVLREGGVIGLANHTVLIAGDGAETPIDDSGAPILDEGGQIVGTVVVFRDITEPRKAERALQESEKRLREKARIVESTDDAILGEALDCTIASWNRGAERMYGYTAEELIGKKLFVLPLAGDEQEMIRLIEVAGRGEAIERYDTKRRHNEGRTIDVALTISPVQKRR